jgi:hypothetical protein
LLEWGRDKDDKILKWYEIENGSICMVHTRPWSRVHLEKLIVTHLVKKSPSFMDTECSLPCLQELATGPIHGQIHPVHTFPPHFPYIQSNIFQSMPRPSKWPLPSNFLNKILYAFLIAFMHTTCPAYSILNLITLIIFRDMYKLWHPSSCSLLQPLATSSLIGPNILTFSVAYLN